MSFDDNGEKRTIWFGLSGPYSVSEVLRFMKTGVPVGGLIAIAIYALFPGA